MENTTITEQITEVYYSFDDIKVVGVTKDGVYAINQDYETKEYMYLMFSRKMWNKLNKEWLDNKMRYCEMWNEFCGVGEIHSHCQKLNEGTYRVYDDVIEDDESTWSGKLIEVPVYYILDIQIDMEHG